MTGEGVRFFVTAPGRFADVHEMVELAAKSDSEGGMGCRGGQVVNGQW